MIRARLSNNTFLFGVDAVNVMRLMHGQPLHVDLREMGGTDRFCIMFGTTYEDVIDEIEKVTGKPMPEVREALAKAREQQAGKPIMDWFEVPHRTSGHNDS